MERHDEAIGMDDLDAFLRFKPWRCAENRLKYLDEAVNQRTIPIIKSLNSTFVKLQHETWTSYFDRFMWDYEAYPILPYRPALNQYRYSFG